MSQGPSVGQCDSIIDLELWTLALSILASPSVAIPLTTSSYVDLDVPGLDNLDRDFPLSALE